jgi:hypothetical protein
MATNAKPHVIGSTSDEDVPDTANDPRFKVLRRGKSRYADRRVAFPLAGLRVSVTKTQVDVAASSGISQGEVSRLERRALDDMEVATLRRYLAGVGAELELVAVVGGERFVLREPDRS